MRHPYIVMDPLTIMVILGFVGTFFSIVKSDQDRATQYQQTKSLQEDAQDFNASEAEKGREWQEKFWSENQSPEALMRQYSSLGASDTAALMSALGVNSSVPSPAVGSSSSSSLPFMGNSFAQLMDMFQGKMNDYYNNQKTKAETEKIGSETEWMPVVNKYTIDKGMAEVDNMRGRLSLDNAIFENVTKPIAQSTIDLNSTEIDKKLAETENLKQEWFNLVEEYYKIKSETYKNYQEGNLSAERAYSEPFVRSKLGAETNYLTAQAGKTNAETFGINLENRFKALSIKTSEELGFDVRLSASSNMLTMAASDAGHVVEILDRQGNWVKSKLEDVFKGADLGLKAVRSSLKLQARASDLYHSTIDFMDHNLPRFSPAYDKWQRQRGKRMFELEDWINRNTRYGYNKDWKPLWNSKNERREYHEHGLIRR